MCRNSIGNRAMRRCTVGCRPVDCRFVAKRAVGSGDADGLHAMVQRAMMTWLWTVVGCQSMQSCVASKAMGATTVNATAAVAASVAGAVASARHVVTGSKMVATSRHLQGFEKFVRQVCLMSSLWVVVEQGRWPAGVGDGEKGPRAQEGACEIRGVDDEACGVSN